MQDHITTTIESAPPHTTTQQKKTTPTNAMTDAESRLLTEREAAAYIRMSMSFLAKDRMNGYRYGIKQGPEFVKTGARNIRYRKTDLDEWILKNRTDRELPK